MTQWASLPWAHATQSLLSQYRPKTHKGNSRAITIKIIWARSAKEEERATGRATTMANAMCAVATATSHEIALRLKDQMARLPALTSVTVAMARAIRKRIVPRPTPN